MPQRLLRRAPIHQVGAPDPRHVQAQVLHAEVHREEDVLQKPQVPEHTVDETVFGILIVGYEPLIHERKGILSHERGKNGVCMSMRVFKGVITCAGLAAVVRSAGRIPRCVIVPYPSHSFTQIPFDSWMHPATGPKAPPTRCLNLFRPTLPASLDRAPDTKGGQSKRNPCAQRSTGYVCGRGGAVAQGWV